MFNVEQLRCFLLQVHSLPAANQGGIDWSKYEPRWGESVVANKTQFCPTLKVSHSVALGRQDGPAHGGPDEGNPGPGARERKVPGLQEGNEELCR